MKLATDTTDFSGGDIGMVELTLSYLNDRVKKYFSKSEIVAYINMAQQQLGNTINKFYEQFFVTSATTTLTGNQSLFALPAEMVKLIGIEVADSTSDDDPQHLVQVPLTHRRFYEHLSAANQKTGYRFFVLQGDAFKLYPEGTQDKTGRIYYVERLVDLADNDDESVIPAEHHELLCTKAAKRGLIKNGRRNPQLDQLDAELVMALESAIFQWSTQDEETTVPFWGTHGPVQYGPSTLDT